MVPVGYGIKKLQIGAVVVDDLVSIEDLEEKIVAFEDFVQSMVSDLCGRCSTNWGLTGCCRLQQNLIV